MDNNFSQGYLFPESNLLREKRELRQRIMFIGITMLISLTAQLFWGTLYFNILALFGVGREKATLLLNDPMVRQLINQLLSAVTVTLPFLIIVSGCQLKLSETASFKAPERKNLLPIILISVSFFSFANIATSVIGGLFAGFGVEVSAPAMARPEGIPGFIVTFIGAAVVAPLVEEFAMRGVVLGALRKYGEGFAIITSALLFGLMHGNLVQIPFAFVIGLALAYAVVKTGSVWTGVIIHFINNAAAVLIDTLSAPLSVTFQMLINTGYFVLCFACLFVGILLLKKDSAEELKIKVPETELSTKMAFANFFTSPLIIIYILFIIANAVI